MAAEFTRDVFDPSFMRFLVDSYRQNTLQPDPTVGSMRAYTPRYLHELLPEDIEGFYPTKRRSPLSDLLDPERRMREQGLE